MRGTTNGNARGSTADRRARRKWLVTAYASDRAVIIVTQRDPRTGDPMIYQHDVPLASLENTMVWFRSAVERGTYGLLDAEPRFACRCYRCGKVLTEETVTADRIIPGCQGGTYRRNNIRPACLTCNSETGGRLGAARKAAK